MFPRVDVTFDRLFLKFIINFMLYQLSKKRISFVSICMYRVVFCSLRIIAGRVQIWAINSQWYNCNLLNSPNSFFFPLPNSDDCLRMVMVCRLKRLKSTNCGFSFIVFESIFAFALRIIAIKRQRCSFDLFQWLSLKIRISQWWPVWRKFKND